MKKNIPSNINVYGRGKGEGCHFFSMWITDEDTLIIHYCPFCGKKLEVIK